MGRINNQILGEKSSQRKHRLLVLQPEITDYSCKGNCKLRGNETAKTESNSIKYSEHFKLVRYLQGPVSRKFLWIFRPKAKLRKFSAGLYEISSPFFSLRDIMIFIVFISKLLEFGSCMQTQHTKEKKKNLFRSNNHRDFRETGTI